MNALAFWPTIHALAAGFLSLFFPYPCLPTAPVVASLAALAPAERLFAALPVLVRRPTDLRRRCEALPVVRLEPNADEALAERIFLIYGFLATAYLRPEGATSDDAGDVLPAPLAVPWAAAGA